MKHYAATLLSFVYISHAPALAVDDPITTFTDIVRFAVVCIKNDTGRSLNYDFKWGDQAYQSFTVGGGATAFRWHSWRYATAGTAVSPTPQIRFDSDLTGGTSRVEYTLGKYAAEDEDCEKGKIYKFVMDHSRRYIDLNSVN